MALSYYDQPSRVQNRQKDKWYHNVGEFVLDPKNIGTAVGGYFGGAQGAAGGRAVGGMIPGPNFGPEDDARKSSLEGGVGSAVGNVATDAVTGYGAYKLGEVGVDKLQGAFADPVTVGVNEVTGAAEPARLHGQIPISGTTGAAGQIDAGAATAQLGQEAQNAEMTEYLKNANKMSTLEKAYLLSNIGSTVANVAGGLMERGRYDEATGPGNPFDLAMAQAFERERTQPGVRSFQDWRSR